MLWLPLPAVHSGMDRVAVADRSALALEWWLLQPGGPVAQWRLADALLFDPWLALWFDLQCATCDQGAPSPRQYVSHSFDLSDLVESCADAFGDALLRPTQVECRIAARSAAGIAYATPNAEAIGGSEFSRYLAACRVLSGATIRDETAEGWMKQYMEIQPGIERRLPALVRRLAGLPDRYVLLHAKLASLQELAYGASHEINNPLANIAGRAQHLLLDEVDPDRRRALEAMHAQALRAHEMISDLMLFAQPPDLTFAEVSLTQLISEVVDTSRTQLRERGIQLQSKLSDVSIACDPHQVRVAIQAAIDNSANACGEDGLIQIEMPARSGNYAGAVIRISDSGSGLTARELQHAFDPFFSGREAGRGLGFGLTKCWRIVTGHGGTVTIANRPVLGAVLEIRLPTTPAFVGEAHTA